MFESDQAELKDKVVVNNHSQVSGTDAAGLALTSSGSAYESPCPTGTTTTIVNGVPVNRYLVNQSDYVSFCSKQPPGTLLTLKYPPVAAMSKEFCTPAQCPGTGTFPSNDMTCVDGPITPMDPTLAGSEETTTAPLTTAVTEYDQTVNYCGPEIGNALDASMQKLQRMIDEMPLLTRQTICASLNDKFINDFDFYAPNETCSTFPPCDRCYLVFGRRQEWGYVNYMLMGHMMRRCGWSMSAAKIAVHSWKICKGQWRTLYRPELWFWLETGYNYGSPDQPPLSKVAIPFVPASLKFDTLCNECPQNRSPSEIGSPLFDKYWKPSPTSTTTPTTSFPGATSPTP